MTIFYSPEEPFAAARDSDEPDSRLQLGIYGQVAALGAAIGMLCLAATLVGSLVLGRGFHTSGSVTETTTATGTNTTQEQQPSETPMDATVADDRPDSTAPTEPTDDATAPSERPPEPVTDERAGFLESIGYFLVGLFVCLLPLLPILPFAFRLFRRRLVRHSIGREPRTADKAARLYQGIISRLAAAEIERDETETPQEFLLFHRTELEELMASSGFGLDEWQELTDAYERVRYAELDPTESELELCWKLYDALPACVRKAVGWRSYLLDAFWGM